MNKLWSISLTALLVMFLAGPGQAQNLSAGVKGGVDFANLGGDIEGTSSKVGFSGGAFVGVDLHEYFRLQFDAQYVQKGAKDEAEGVDLKLKLDYIELMVPATLKIPIENSPVSPRLFAGPAIALEASCKLSGEEGGVSVDADCADAGFETKSIDFGVFFGGGLDVAVGNGAITLDALYNLGLGDINDTPDDTDKIKNQNIQVMVGYRFFFGG